MTSAATTGTSHIWYLTMCVLLRCRQLAPPTALRLDRARRPSALEALYLHMCTFLKIHCLGLVAMYKRLLLKVKLKVRRTMKNVNVLILCVSDTQEDSRFHVAPPLEPPWSLVYFTYHGSVCSLPLSHFSSSAPRRNLRNDLLVAADSITNTVSSLVKELHSGTRKHVCFHESKRFAQFSLTSLSMDLKLFIYLLVLNLFS